MATNAYGNSLLSNSDLGYCLVASPSVPTGVSASDGTYTDKIVITWNAATSALYYEIWRNTNNHSASASVIAQTTNSTTYTDTLVSVGVTYYYWLKGKNNQTTSAFSNPDSGYISYSPPTPAGSADLYLSDLVFLPTILTNLQHPGAISVSLFNNGPNNLASPNTRIALDLYLSANGTFGDGDDISMGDYSSDQTLTAGSSISMIVPSSGRSLMVVPETVTTGVYNVFARVRHAYPSGLTDPDESNNYTMRLSPVRVYAVDPNNPVPIPIYHVINDYDGDYKSDLALYQESSGTWIIMLSDSGYHTATAVLGGTGYNPALGDYDGDTKSDLAIYQQSTGLWQFMLSGSGYSNTSFVMGGPGYTPIPGDFDGDGKVDPTVYQESSGLWQILMSASHYEPTTVSLGGNGYKAVACDFDGDGKSDIAVYRRSTGDWQIMLSSLQYWTTIFRFGVSGSVPVPADYDGDNKTDPGVFKDSNGEWNVMMSQYNYLTATATFGDNKDVAVPADYDGDGKADIVIYSEQDGELKALLSGNGYTLTTVPIGGPTYDAIGYYDW